VTWAPVMLLAATVREREVSEAALHDQRNQLAHMQRLATVGELSVALAHELRQPMTSILANAQAGLRLLASAPSNVALMREILEDIVQADKQAANVISRLRSVLRSGDPTFEPVAIESVISDALALTRSTVENAQVTVQVEVPAGLPRVLGDQVQLLQVLVNLVVNGCESMLDVPAADRALTVYVRRAGLDRLEVSVGDCGVGLPVAEEDRVFEPFFTTKSDGVGLGLSIGRSIAGAHGGRLWAENNHGRRGATFYLELPTAIRLEA
jgi:two-component system, LuxR family, sensor kinase FixL